MEKKKSLTAALITSAIAIAGGVILLKSSASIPKGAHAIHPFDSKRYLGKWYEIARLDLIFERNLINVTATYSENKNGTIKVVNRGYETVKKIWKEAVGKAKFRGEANTAALKVSFFGPFYSGYNVIAIDPNYQYALVAGSNLDYLWILSREKQIPENIKREYLAKAEGLGYDTSKLIWVEQEDNY